MTDLCTYRYIRWCGATNNVKNKYTTRSEEINCVSATQKFNIVTKAINSRRIVNTLVFLCFSPSSSSSSSKRFHYRRVLFCATENSDRKKNSTTINLRDKHIVRCSLSKTGTRKHSLKENIYYGN